MLSRNNGVVIMAPPSDNAEARKNIATLLSAIKPKQKVGGAWARRGGASASVCKAGRHVFCLPVSNPRGAWWWLDTQACFSALPALHSPQVVVAESYGGRDEPLDSLTAGFVAAGVEPLLDLRVKEEPSEAVYQVGAGWG